MNILPKKRWHVRTKDNIARVRKDEAEAQEQEVIRLKKQSFAESEARINILRSKALGRVVIATNINKDGHHHKTQLPSSDTEHINLFSEDPSFTKISNSDHDQEKKEDREKYEKQIGYLTYLGQDTNEALKLKSWYEVIPKRIEIGESSCEEKDLKNKYNNDPLTIINAVLPSEKINVDKTKCETINRCSNNIVSKCKGLEYLSTKKSAKHKKTKKHKKNKKKNKKIDFSQEKKSMIEKLRKERLNREAREQQRQAELLNAPTQKSACENKLNVHHRIQQKYNCQFNPELAKQNMN